MIKVLVADDHPIIREGVKQILADTADIVVKDEAGDGNQVLNKIRTVDFDAVLLDLSMPGISGMDILKQIKKEKPNLPVLVLSRYSEDEFAIPVLKAGAAGYVCKMSIVEDLVRALYRVASGKKYISASLAEKLAGYVKQDISTPLHTTLSDREMEVLCLIAAGKSLIDIADEFCLSPTTISTYRARIFKKMGFKNNAELIRYAMENDLTG